MSEPEYVPLRERLCVPGKEQRVRIQNYRDALERVVLGYLGPTVYEKTDLAEWTLKHCVIWNAMPFTREVKRTLEIDGVPFCAIHQEGRFGRVRLEWLVDERARW